MHYATIFCIFVGYINVLTVVTTQDIGTCNVCGRTNSLKRTPIIIRGHDVVPYNKYPWVIRMEDAGTRKTACGGAIISEYFILTAAHCVSTPGKWVVVFVDNTVGKIAEIHAHPLYNDKTLKNDIALLQLASPIQCGESVSPICLPLPSTPPPIPGSKMGVNGWGSTIESYEKVKVELSSVLKEAEITILDPKACIDSPIFHPELSHCVSGLGVQGVCYGDSGGIGYTKLGNSYFATGITSFHFSELCRASIPVIYTKVSAFMDWITEVSNVTSSTAFA